MADLSVVIPTHNRRQQLLRAVDSVVSQGHEAVVVDDASSDGTSALAAQFAADGVHYRRLEVNQGPGVARNLGLRQVSADLVLFLDDDDELLPGGGRHILDVAAAHPEWMLYLHNCVYPDGRLSVTIAPGTHPLDYTGWLRGDYHGELKPVARLSVFETYSYEDTGASGEALLWGKVIRHHAALVSHAPVVRYDTRHADRLTSASGLLARAPANATIAHRFLDEFGHDLVEVNRRSWRRRILALAGYHVLAGRRRDGLRAVLSLARRDRDGVGAVLGVLGLSLPADLLRLVLQRRH